MVPPATATWSAGLPVWPALQFAAHAGQPDTRAYGHADAVRSLRASRRAQPEIPQRQKKPKGHFRQREWPFVRFKQEFAATMTLEPKHAWIYCWWSASGSQPRAGAGLHPCRRVLVSEQKIDKPGATVAGDAPVRLLGDDPPYVSRGGLSWRRRWSTGRLQLKAGLPGCGRITAFYGLPAATWRGTGDGRRYRALDRSP